MEPTAYNITVLAKNLQGQHQDNVVINPTRGSSLEYRHIIKGPTRSICVNSLENEISWIVQGLVAIIPSVTNAIFFISQGGV